MSKDGMLPDNVSEADPNAPWNQGDHLEACPQSEDARDQCTCGHALEDIHVEGICFAVMSNKSICPCMDAEKVEAVCTCLKLAEAAEIAKADAAESAAEERRLGL